MALKPVPLPRGAGFAACAGRYGGGMGGMDGGGAQGGGGRPLSGPVARRRAALDDADGPPHLRVTDEPAHRHRRLLAAKQRADAVVEETSAEVARSFGAPGWGAIASPASSGSPASSFFPARPPAVSRLTLILVLVALVLIGPRLIGTLLAGLAGGAGLLILAIVAGAGLYVAGGRLFARRRAELAGENTAVVLDQLASDSRRRLTAIIDEWFRIDDTLGIGTALESAYAREPRSPELDRVLRSIIDSIDDAMADGHDALAALGDMLGPGGRAGFGGQSGVGNMTGGPDAATNPDTHAASTAAANAEWLRRIDAADHAYLRLRFYRRALDN